MSKGFVIGIDLGGTNIKGALLDQAGQMRYKREIPTLANSGPETVAKRIGGIIIELESLANDEGLPVLGAGIGVPGQADQDTGMVVWAPNLRWHNVPLVEFLRRETDLPLWLENDANVAAVGERWLGAGKGSNNMIMITIGTGIGGGLILNGRLYRGSNGSAGEVGHMIVYPNGPLCNCGRKGCLETLTSATAMLRMAKEAIDSGQETMLAAFENLEARDIFIAVQEGDKVAHDIVDTAAKFLGIGLGNLINIFNPDTIVVGGGVSKAGKILFDPLRKYVFEFALEAPSKAVNILPAKLGNDAGCIGAAGLVLTSIYPEK